MSTSEPEEKTSNDLFYKRRGYIYFTRMGNYVKVGFSKNPAERASTFLRGQLPEDLDRNASREVLVTSPGVLLDELKIHPKLLEHRAKGTREWYHYDQAFHDRILKICARREARAQQKAAREAANKPAVMRPDLLPKDPEPEDPIRPRGLPPSEWRYAILLHLEDHPEVLHVTAADAYRIVGIHVSHWSMETDKHLYNVLTGPLTYRRVRFPGGKLKSVWYRPGHVPKEPAR